MHKTVRQVIAVSKRAIGGKNIIEKYTLEEEAIAWDTLNAQADDKQEPTKYLKTMIGGSPT